MAHGSHQFSALAPKSKFYQGPFGRICGDLPAWQAPVAENEIDDYLLNIANNHMIERPGATPGEIANDQSVIQDLEKQFSSNIPAGYTYFGQFVDHDITFDPASSLMRSNDPHGLINFRTPRLDLDNIYGAGPHDQPYLFDPNDSAKMAIGHVPGRADLPDLPRFGDRALIGDMRNDENSIVSQLQLAFLLAHNTLVDRARNLHPAAGNSEIFEMARTSLRWLYQHIVWFDFMPRITVDEVHKYSLMLETTKDNRKRWTCSQDDLYSWKHQPFMPVEFSVAAYRFGHSMVRNSYQTNNPERRFNNFAPIFDNTGANANPDDLRGFRPMSPENSIQWDWFLDMTTTGGPFPQMARKIDTKLANSLAFLHEGPAGDPLNVLAFRNLKRGLAFNLPSGTAVADKLCINKVNLNADEPDALWYYVLREGQRVGGNSLGRVGSTIVCAVFAGLLKGDPCSWVNQNPCWTPDDDPLLVEADKIDSPDKWTLASIIRLSGIRSDGIGF